MAKRIISDVKIKRVRATTNSLIIETEDGRRFEFTGDDLNEFSKNLESLAKLKAGETNGPH